MDKELKGPLEPVIERIRQKLKITAIFMLGLLIGTILGLALPYLRQIINP